MSFILQEIRAVFKTIDFFEKYSTVDYHILRIVELLDFLDSPRRLSNMLDCRILESNFKLSSRGYVYFQTIIIGNNNITHVLL